MNCPKCKTEVSQPAVFCPECGANMIEVPSETVEAIKEEMNEQVESPINETVAEAVEQVLPTEEPVEVTAEAAEQVLPAEEPVEVIAEAVEQVLPTEEPVEAIEEVLGDIVQEPISETTQAEQAVAEAEILSKATQEASEAVAAQLGTSEESSGSLAGTPVVAQAISEDVGVAPVAGIASPSKDELKQAQKKKKAEEKEKRKLEKAKSLSEIPKEMKPFSTIGAFGFLLLLSIPIVGFISLIIFAFAGKNVNRKSVARAFLIAAIIGFIISLGVSIAATVLLKDEVEEFRDHIEDSGNIEISVGDHIYVVEFSS